MRECKADYVFPVTAASLFLLTLPAAEFDSIRATIPARLEASDTASVAIAAVRGGKLVWEEAFGWADKESRVPATPHTMYSLASISKPVTATALMLLVEQGKVELDAPISRYLAAPVNGRAFDAAAATVRRVANHSSGLPLHYQFFYEDEPYLPPPMAETIRRYANLITPPGERYQYSNLGYGLLDHVISRVSGIPYEQFLRERVFQPMGLGAMSIHPLPGRAHATRYSGGVPIPFYDFDHRGGSAVYASAHDLARFAMLHLKTHEAAVLSAAAIDEMQRPTMRTGPSAFYGIGWAISDANPRVRLVSHSGGMGGVSTMLLLAPSRKAAVAVLANSSSKLPAELSREILEAMVPELRQKAVPPVAAPRETNDLSGVWRGSVSTPGAEIPVRIDFTASRMHLGGQEAPLSGGSVTGGYFSARTTGDLGATDANRRAYSLSLLLRRRGEVVNGGVTALSHPGLRAGNALTYWMELRKDASLADARLLRTIPLDGRVHHVQGIVVEGNRLWVTAVDTPRLRGFLHEFELPASGPAKLLRSVEIQRGLQFHPGGFSADDRSLWIPVAEYRRTSTATIQRRNKRTLELEAEFHVDDHIGCLAVSGSRLYGGNWDSRQIYIWDRGGRLLKKVENPARNSFQDLKVSGGWLVGGGTTSEGPAIDWLDPESLEWKRRMMAGKTDRGANYTREGLDLHGRTLYLLPEDDPSRLFVFAIP
ncbi:MAG: DUF6454 family protein [Bryobacteraceae bacterium]|nr:DUF6454 family protein [Bryobacteraceae bacterium]